MNKSRLEAFSDGVIAIIITIMILELKVPKSNSFESLTALIPGFFSYVLSFAYVAISPAQKGKTIWLQKVTDAEYNSVK